MQRFVFTFIFSFFLSLMMSAWVTYINLGFSAVFVDKWMIAFVNAWPAAFTVAFLLNKPVARLTEFVMRRFIATQRS